MRKKLLKLPAIQFLSSVKIMTACLLWLFILTFWGTLYQTDHGLFPAQARFFNSFIFSVLGFFPLPGAQLVMWIMFVNLVFVSLFRFVYKIDRLGIMIIHSGIFLLLLSAFVTFYFSQESSMTLREGEGSSMSSAYHDWELAVWKDTGGHKRKVIAYDFNILKEWKSLNFSEFGFKLAVKAAYLNSQAYGPMQVAQKDIPMNSSGIAAVKSSAVSSDPQKNIPGAIFALSRNEKEDARILLYGADENPTGVVVHTEPVYFMVRPKRFALPFTLQLVDFRMEKHPGTEVAKSYESTVSVNSPEMTRETVISMNNPLRYKSYTFYQSSYAIDEQGHEHSTFAVVRNSGRLLPYISCIVTFIGLATHFLLILYKSLTAKAKRRDE